MPSTISHDAHPDRLPEPTEQEMRWAIDLVRRLKGGKRFEVFTDREGLMPAGRVGTRHTHVRAYP